MVPSWVLFLSVKKVPLGDRVGSYILVPMLPVLHLALT